MKIEIGKEFPRYFKPLYPEEFNLFHHFETTAGIPSVLFAITTWKENGKAEYMLPCMELFSRGQDSIFCRDGKFVSAYAYVCEY